MEESAAARQVDNAIAKGAVPASNRQVRLNVKTSDGLLHHAHEGCLIEALVPEQQ